MGGTIVGGSYKAYDWSTGMELIQASTLEEYGHQDGYSGAEHDVRFAYLGDKSDLYGNYKTNKTVAKALMAYREERIENLSTRDGEVIRLGTLGYNILRTKTYDLTKSAIWRVFGNEFDYVLRLLRESKSPAILVTQSDTRGVAILKSGTLSELKRYGHDQLRKDNYTKPLYIIGKNNSFILSGTSEFKEKTSKMTNASVLVVPVYEFIYYGWAPS